jgi:uncharacterized protein with beta-barrel porin domain
MRTGDVAAMVALQNATNDDERRVALSCAQSDAEVGRLIQITRETFGDDAARKVSEAVNDEGDAEVDAGKLAVNGKTASLTFVGSDSPTPMILVDGGWKIDIAALLKESDGTADSLSDSVIRRGSSAKITRQELVAGHYTTVDALVDALKDRLKDQ